MAQASTAGHDGVHPDGVWRSWSLDPELLIPVALMTGLYLRGLWAWRDRTRRHPWWRTASYLAGVGVLLAAVESPLDALAAHHFSMHMVQHELLMVVAAPLLVLARPLEAFAWSLPKRWLDGLAGATRWRPLRSTWELLTTTSGAWLLQAVAIWGWHVPVVFQASLRSEAIHALQHATFLATALAFWWTVLAPHGKRDGAGLASVFTTLLHTGALGALLTFAPNPLYPAYEGGWGMTALEDQQLAGLVMWVPGGLAYLAGCLALTASWLAPGREGERVLEPR
jgi:cytochrome c oxidase assembly factor CtaG